MFPVRERGAHGGGRVIADAFAAGAADVLVVLREIPQPQRPVHPAGDKRPVFVFDLRPQFHRQACCADRARVPSVRRVGFRLLVGLAVGRGDLRTSRLERASPIGGRLALHFLDECRQRRFGVGRNGEIDLRVPHVVAVVAALEQVARGDADDLRGALTGLA